jgi:hypothetical protein
MFLAQAEAAVKTIDHVAAQNDRWAFFASLGILLIFGYFVLRHFMVQSQILSAANANALDKYHSSLNKLMEAGNEINRTLGIALSKNTDVLEKCVKELEKIRKKTE